MIAMLVILSLLTLVVTFGLGFIIDMLTPWWTSAVVYAALVVYVLIRTSGVLKAFDWTLVIIGAVGAVASGLVIRSLRRRGFRMFG
ncbi:MAG: YuiB family protein [Kyrpidia sp.]|nr:YuiB family protein [Kyrpidia sp.]